MNKKALIILILLILVAFIGFKFFSSRTTGIAGLKIVSTPAVDIFIDDKLTGKTPYEGKHSVGEYILKLIPESTATQASSWQGKIVLNPSVLTYVNRELGVSELTSAGEILTLEKISQNQAQLAVFSQPGAAVVLLNSEEKGATPLLVSDLTPGEYDLAVSSPGFIGRTVRIQATSGYKLVVNFQLALASGGSELSESVVTPSPSEKLEKEPSRPYVVIKDTPTGFLRVRTAPTTSATEAAQVKPGEKYSFLEEKEGWYKISYNSGKDGWISGRYADKVE